MGEAGRRPDEGCFIKSYQKILRKHATDTEMKLWFFLRNRRFYGFKFRRQQVLKGFIVDFICYEKKLIVELDGGQHNEQEEYDINRTKILEKEGFHILRFWNHDFLQNKDEVLSVIYEALMK